jgi:crotonobetainyl-CoA:carnitine CoA-transferase CaiB-like acyl-CoA transferase
LYETSDKRFVAFGALERKFWETFCNLVQREDLKPLHHPLEPAKADWVRSEITTMVGAQPLAYWMDKLRGSDCCVTPVLKLEETIVNEQFKAREMMVESTTASGRAFVQLACPVKMTGFKFSVRHPAPSQGQHTQEILSQAGYSAVAVNDLLSKGAVACIKLD